MDDKDRRIITYLMDKGRDKISDISRALDIPRVTVYERIKTMQNQGLIKKFTIIPDYTAIGLPLIAFVYVQFDPAGGISERDLATRISNIPTVREVHIITGEWDLLLKVRAESMETLGTLVLDRLREMKGILKTQTLTVFKTVKEDS